LQRKEKEKEDSRANVILVYQRRLFYFRREAETLGAAYGIRKTRAVHRARIFFHATTWSVVMSRYCGHATTTMGMIARRQPHQRKKESSEGSDEGKGLGDPHKKGTRQNCSSLTGSLPISRQNLFPLPHEPCAISRRSRLFRRRIRRFSSFDEPSVFPRPSPSAVSFFFPLSCRLRRLSFFARKSRSLFFHYSRLYGNSDDPRSLPFSLSLSLSLSFFLSLSFSHFPRMRERPSLTRKPREGRTSSNSG